MLCLAGRVMGLTDCSGLRNPAFMSAWSPVRDFFCRAGLIYPFMGQAEPVALRWGGIDHGHERAISRSEEPASGQIEEYVVWLLEMVTRVP